jgi:parallel beta-helix repeat protein
VVNQNITSMIEEALTGRAVISTWTSNAATVTTANGISSAGRAMMLDLSGTLTAAGTLTVPTANKMYIVRNGTAGGFPVDVGMASGAAVTVPQGTTVLIYTDGTNTGTVSTSEGYSLISKKEFVATDGQTEFTWAFPVASIGSNNISVYVNGSRQRLGTSYTEDTDGLGITFSSGLNAGDYVEVLLGVGTSDLNANLVEYTPAGTGAVATDVQSKLREVISIDDFTDEGAYITHVKANPTPYRKEKLGEFVSVKDFGAVGDGVTDDTAAIQTAIDAIASGGELVFPPGTYKITSTISKTFANNVTIGIRGYGAKIDGTAVTGSTAGETVLLTLAGSRSTSSLLNASPSKNDTTITTSSSVYATNNDVVLITSTDLWNPSRAYYYKGELAEVVTVSGNTLNVSNPLFDGYTAATTTVHKLNMPTISVEGLEIEMDANQIALSVQYTRNPTIRNCKVYGARYTGIQLLYCFGGNVENNNVFDSWYSGTGTSYNISLSSCQGTSVKGNLLHQARHNITSGGNEPCRNLLYFGNLCKMHPSAPDGPMSIDMHGNTELSSIIGNVCEGIIIAGINILIQGNTVTGNAVGGAVTPLILLFQEISSDYYLIKDNTLTTSSTGYGIWVSPSVASILINTLDISGNHISTGSRNALHISPRNSSITGCSIDTLIIASNCLTASGSQAFAVNVLSGVSISIARLLSSNNVYDASAFDAFTMVSGATVALVQSVNDVFRGNRLGGYLAQFEGTDVILENPRFDGNTGGAGNARSIRYINSGYVRCTNPTFSGLTYKAELDTGGPVEYQESGWKGATPTILNTAASRLINFYGALGRAVTYSTAAPASGTWAVGDRVFNQVPAVGQPKGWLCTVAGTPGTWVAEDALALPISGSATYDPGGAVDIADGAGETTTVTATGAALGDFAQASFSQPLQGVTLTAWVSATDTVSVRFQNESGGAVDLASGTLRVRVTKP